MNLTLLIVTANFTLNVVCSSYCFGQRRLGPITIAHCPLQDANNDNTLYIFTSESLYYPRLNLSILIRLPPRCTPFILDLTTWVQNPVQLQKYPWFNGDAIVVVSDGHHKRLASNVRAAHIKDVGGSARSAAEDVVRIYQLESRPRGGYKWFKSYDMRHPGPGGSIPNRERCGEDSTAEFCNL